VVINGLGSDVDTVVQNKKNLILGKGAILEDVRHRYLSVA